MEAQHIDSKKEDKTWCYRSRVRYESNEDMIYVEHYSQDGELLSKVRMDYEDAYSYAQMLFDVADVALGVE